MSIESDSSTVELSVAIDAALRDVPTRRHIQSLIVARNNEVKFEAYFRDRRPDDLTNIHSVTKSFIGTLTGIAIDKGLLSLDTSLDEIFETLGFDDERKRQITIEQLLTMTSGLDADTPHDIDEIADRGESWIEGPLAAPLHRERPFMYNNGAVQVLAAALARSIGTPLQRFAESELFTPLGISAYRWPTDPLGNPLGYGHLEVRPRDLLRLGQLYLDGGRIEGTQLVPAAFVDAATTPQNGGGDPEGVPYGYLWWTTEDCGYRSFFAGGYGGQYITVVPELSLVVVTTGDVDVFIETSRNLRHLVAETIIPALT